jgi:hypothetical protein
MTEVELTAIETNSQDPSDNYPFSSAQFDPSIDDAHHVQRVLTGRLFSKSPFRVHHLCVLNGDLRTSTLDERDGDLHAWHRATTASGDPTTEIFFIPHKDGASRFSVSASTLTSILDILGVPLSFIEMLCDNNGVLNSGQLLDEDGHSDGLEVQVKVPVAPFVSGAWFFRHCVATGKTQACIFFNETMLLRIISILDIQTGSTFDPFTILNAVLADMVRRNEEYRQKLDADVVLRERSTGATLIADPGRIPKAPIEEYPPLFDKLHNTQQALMYLEAALEFQVRLAGVLREQQEVLMKMRLESVTKEKRMDIRQAQKVKVSLDMKRSQSEHALKQVQTLGLRIRIQLGIVSLGK